MTPDNFCYWLKGFIELENPETMTKEQVEEIKRHLNIVFNTVPISTNSFDYVPPSNLMYSYHRENEGTVQYKQFYGSC